jgi:anti-sigma28 factor (negative regulator of flagellin synthesis)
MEYMEPKNVSRMLEENHKVRDSGKSKETSGTRRTSGRRPRSLTTLKLEIISERGRKIQRIKEAIRNGNYEVDSSLVATSLLRNFDEKDLG